MCLYSAVGLDGHEPDEKDLPGTTSFGDPATSTVLDQDLATGQYASAMVWPFYDQATQTEMQMLTMQEFESVIQKIQKDLVEKLAPHFQPVPSSRGSDE